MLCVQHPATPVDLNGPISGCGACGFAGRGCPHSVNMPGVRLDLLPALVRLPRLQDRQACIMA